MFLPGESQGQGSLVGCHLWGLTESDTTEAIYNSSSSRDNTEDFPGGSVIKHLTANAANAGSIPGSGRSPGEGNGNPFQYSCLGNPTNVGDWWDAVHGVTKRSN